MGKDMDKDMGSRGEPKLDIMIEENKSKKNN